MSEVNRGWQYTTRGLPSQTLKLVENEIPTAAPDEVVIQIHAAALNPVDVQFAQSPDPLLKALGAAPIGTPFIPGADFAGVVVQAGKGWRWRVGDEVFGMRMNPDGNGTLQEYQKMPASSPIAPKPPSLSFTEAAAIPLVYSTVFGALVEEAKLPFDPTPQQKGKRSVLILGGSSGTGSVAVQLAKKMGLNVVATCSGKNAEFVKGLGANEIIDYRTEHVAERALTSQYAPFAAILDCVGGTDLIPYLNHLVLDDPKEPELGVYITIVGDKTSRDEMGGPITYATNPWMNVRYYRGKMHDVLPQWLPFRSLVAGKRYVCYHCVPSSDQLETVSEFLESAGKVTVDSVFPFEDTKKAYERLESSRAVGKVVVEVIPGRS